MDRGWLGPPTYSAFSAQRVVPDGDCPIEATGVLKVIGQSLLRGHPQVGERCASEWVFISALGQKVYNCHGQCRPGRHFATFNDHSTHPVRRCTAVVGRRRLLLFPGIERRLGNSDLLASCVTDERDPAIANFQPAWSSETTNATPPSRTGATKVPPARHAKVARQPRACPPPSIAGQLPAGRPA